MSLIRSTPNMRVNFSSRLIAFVFLLASSSFMPYLPAHSQEALRSIQPRFNPDPMVYSGTTEGKVSCQGSPSHSPSHTLNIKQPFGFLSLKVFANNATLLVKGPDGSYCREGNNPELSGAWVNGSYQIWVSSQSGDRFSYRLSISETKQ